MSIEPVDWEPHDEPRDLEQAVREITDTIMRSISLEIESIAPPAVCLATRIKQALECGAEQAARNIVASIEEYGR